MKIPQGPLRRREWQGAQRAVRRAAHTLGVIEVQVRVIARTLRDTADNLGDPASNGSNADDDGTPRSPRRIGGAQVKAGAADSGRAVTPDDDTDADGNQPALPMAADMLTSTAGAIEAFVAGWLPGSGSGSTASLDTARAAVAGARSSIEQMNADLADLVPSNLPRGIYIGTLVVETGRILDELEQELA